MGRLGGALHAYALDSPDPSDVLTRVGRLAEVDAALATALYAVLDPATGTSDIASAGHLPPLSVHPKTGPEYLGMDEGLSPLLGLSVDSQGQSRSYATTSWPASHRPAATAMTSPCSPCGGSADRRRIPSVEPAGAQRVRCLSHPLGDLGGDVSR
jgi:hypothetical protein